MVDRLQRAEEEVVKARIDLAEDIDDLRDRFGDATLSMLGLNRKTRRRYFGENEGSSFRDRMKGLAWANPLLFFLTGFGVGWLVREITWRTCCARHSRRCRR